MSFIDKASIREIAIIGAGTIGASWTAYFLARGFHCCVSDPAPGAADRVREFVRTCWDVLTSLGTTSELLDEALSRLSFEPDAAKAAANADFVQENAPETLDTKRSILSLIDEALPADRIIASSTSGLTATAMQQGMVRPERLVVGHPFNPPHLMPLVEIVGGENTSPEATLWAAGFYEMLGKTPIVLNREMRGHIANRLQAALWREAVHLVLEGVASVGDIDKAVHLGPGLRWAIMGQHMIFHLGGGEGGIGHFVDHLGPAVQTWWDDLGSPDLSDEVRNTLAAGIDQATQGLSYQELAKWRDKRLVEMLKTVRPR